LHLNAFFTLELQNQPQKTGVFFMPRKTRATTPFFRYRNCIYLQFRFRAFKTPFKR